MLARKFDVDTSSLAYDRQAGTLSMTVQPLVATYDETAILAHGWGVLAGCPELRRLCVNVEIDDAAVALGRLPMRRAA